MYLQLQQHVDTGLANRPFAKNEEKDIMREKERWSGLGIGGIWRHIFAIFLVLGKFG